MSWIDKRKMDEISEAESKKNLEELEKRFLKNNQLENEKNLMNGNKKLNANDILKQSNDYQGSEDDNLNASELLEVSKKVEFKPKTTFGKVSSFLSKSVFGQPQSSKSSMIKPSLAKRGPKQGTSYQKVKTNKYRYLRNVNGRAIKKLGLNPNYKGNKTEFRINKKTGRLQIKLRKTSPQFVKTAFSKGIKRLQSFESQSQFEKKRQAFYQQQQQAYELGLDIGDFEGMQHRLNPFLENQELTNTDLARFNSQLSQSNWEYQKSQLEHKRKVALMDFQRKQLVENQRQSNQLNSENMFSPNNPFMQSSRIDILQNIFSNAQSIMKQRPDSLNLLSTGRKNILQAENIMKSDENFNILKAKNLFGGG